MQEGEGSFQGFSGQDLPTTRQAGGVVVRAGGIQQAVPSRSHGDSREIPNGGVAAVYAYYNREVRKQGRPAIPQFAVLNYHKWPEVHGQYDLLTDRRGRQKSVHRHGFPDPFDPRFEAAARKQAEDSATPVRNDPNFVAWFVDNEIGFVDLHRYVWSRHCGRALVAFLEKRYPRIDELNKRPSAMIPTSWLGSSTCTAMSGAATAAGTGNLSRGTLPANRQAQVLHTYLTCDAKPALICPARLALPVIARMEGLHRTCCHDCSVLTRPSSDIQTGPLLPQALRIY